jgi:hypothetical protein
VTSVQQTVSTTKSIEHPAIVSEDLNMRIEEAERKLAKATEMFGDDHPKVADCLDELAGLLRRAKIRTLASANMEARARVIRSKTN